MKVFTNSLGKWLFGVVALLLLSVHSSQAASILDIGTQYRLRGISISKADFGATNQDYSFYSQRALAHIGGRFSPNIEMMTQFEAIGIFGSSGTVNSSAAKPAGGRYPYTKFTPWNEWACLKDSQLHHLPVVLTSGRQANI